MKSYTLVQYGTYNLQKDYVKISNANGERSTNSTIQRLNNVRGTGSTPVNRSINEKTIQLSGWLTKTDTKTLTQVYGEVATAMNINNRYLRFIREWDVLAPATNYAIWTLGGDGINLANETENYFIDGGVKFDIDVSATANDYVTLTTSGITVFSMEDFCDSVVEMPIYIPDVSQITGVSLIIGNDTSNYFYSADQITQFDGLELQNGWNYFSIPLCDMTEVGGVNIASISYVKVQINYSSLASDINGCVFGGVLVQNDEQTRNHRVQQLKLSTPDLHYNVEMTPIDIEVLAYNGTAVSTVASTIMDITGITDASFSDTVIFDGTAEPLPNITMSFATASGTGDVTITNTTTNSSVSISNAFVSDDILRIQADTKTVTINDVESAYNDTIPLFTIGRNDLTFTVSNASPITVEFTSNNGSVSSADPNTKYAQSFIATQTGTVSIVELYLSGYLQVGGYHPTIHTDNSGSPSASLYASLSLPTGYENVTTLTYVPYTTSMSVTSGTKYWIVFPTYAYKAFPFGETFYRNWGVNSSGGYSSNELKYYNGSSWVTTGISGYDANFSLDINTPQPLQYDVNINFKRRYI